MKPVPLNGSYTGSVIEVWDSGPGHTLNPPVGNLPPTDSATNVDPHGDPRATPLAQQQISDFLRAERELRGRLWRCALPQLGLHAVRSSRLPPRWAAARRQHALGADAYEYQIAPVDRIDRMRIALVSPYSWTYPGGVTRHIEALAEQYLAAGHDVRVLAPYDPPDRTSTVLHRGARPQHLRTPDYLVPLGRTVGFKRERRRVEPADRAGRHDAKLSRELSERRLRRRPRPRAGRADGRLGRHAAVRRAARRHVPLLFDQAAAEHDRQRLRRHPGSEPSARSDRRLRGGGLDRSALVRRSLPGHPQRRQPRPGRARHSALDRADRRTTTLRSCSSGRRLSARGCRCCCARSRRCASTSPPS